MPPKSFWIAPILSAAVAWWDPIAGLIVGVVAVEIWRKLAPW